MFMKRDIKRFSALVAVIALLLAAPSHLRAQQMQLNGTIVKQDGGSIFVKDNQGRDHEVVLSANTEIKERKSNPFRLAKTYSQQQLVRGLEVQINGRSAEAGKIVAEKIRFTHSEFRVAEAIEKRVTPVEQDLQQAEQNLQLTSKRVGQAEQNALRMSGQLEELSSVANAARGGAKAAQESANDAIESASRANSGVEATNTRITTIDDYQVKNLATVNFKVGSSMLSKEAQAALDQLAQGMTGERAYVIEVSGHASAEGSKTLNRRLSQSRADEVIRYLAENYNIPLRRFVTPLGLGTAHPVADNSTRAGREENRRVEVRILVSKGLAQSANSTTGVQNVNRH
jgi:OmpA-OmpF porin, OOP family